MVGLAWYLLQAANLAGVDCGLQVTYNCIYTVALLVLFETLYADVTNVQRAVDNAGSPSFTLGTYENT